MDGARRRNGRRDDLARGRERSREGAWADAYEALCRADEREPLAAEDLELLATSAYLTGRDAEYFKALDRAHASHLDNGLTTRAARCAFWLGLNLLFQGETGRGTGWLGTARRLVEREAKDCAERGYLMLQEAEHCLMSGNNDAAFALATDAAQTGERFGDADIVACALHTQGKVFLNKGRIDEGLALLDEAMIAVTGGGLSPIMRGLIYCSVIDACQCVYAFDRAREWTDALASWCDEQPQLVAFTGRCLVHRAEIFQIHGSWRDAMEEARRAGERATRRSDKGVSAEALYRQAEVHRLRGEYSEAEDGYAEAARLGGEPQPGMALLRLAQGRTQAAATSIRHALDAIQDPLERSRILPAFVDIMLAAGDLDSARRGGEEIETLARRFATEALAAMAAHAKGAVALADGDVQTALGELRAAWRGWQSVEAPYPAACTRLLMGQASRLLGDEDGAGLALAAARAEFEVLGAAPDIARIDSLTAGREARDSHGLTLRELQVLRLVAAGKTNKAIASELSLSPKTIDRHLSNIFNKLDTPSRAAATAYAYEHGLV